MTFGWFYIRAMATIDDVIKRMLPFGTNPASVEFSPLKNSKSWDKVPLWPPDTFAVAAAIVENSSCYTDERYSCKSGSNFFFGKTYIQRVERAAATWNENEEPPHRVHMLWRVLLKYRHQEVSHPNTAWRDAAMELLAIADEASSGMGLSEIDEGSKFATLAHLLHIGALKTANHRFLSSLCLAVPPSEACVQPKTVTSQVGCTLRSLSHHICLLPAISQVRTRWNISAEGRTSQGPLNLLLVPFPYKIPSNAFQDMGAIDDAESKSSHFEMTQSWLPKVKPEAKIAGLLLDLIKVAETDLEKVHGVVLPELALDFKTAQKVGRILHRKTNLEFFISGVLNHDKNKVLSRNQAYMSLFKKKKTNFLVWTQSKHHRWKLDGRQLKRYQLENRLDPQRFWWEQIDISDREANFYVFRSGASMAVLVCEDLARIDPIQPVLRSIGPNLVVALLQDGPQTLSRWSSRYATVLSDDPGSAVLCLTSQGMVDRSMLPTDTEFRRVIALWKDPESGARELTLKNGEHAIVLKLRFSTCSSWTLDGRSCNEATTTLKLEGAHSISSTIALEWT